MKIAVGSDHAGVHMKGVLAARLREQGHEVADLGTLEERSVDYPDYARLVGEAVAEGRAERGLLVCGTGQGMAMTANKVRGVRAAVVSESYSARMTREHNDSNVLCLGARVVGEGVAIEILDAWVSTAFLGGRHATRVGKIEG